jgi:hypothetical protein
MTPITIAFIFSFGFAFVIVCFPGIIFRAIDYIDYKLKQFVAWIVQTLTEL